MEDILDVYERPYDKKRPMVCMDKRPYQLLDEARELLPMRPDNDRKLDSQYVRHCTCSIFVFSEPLAGRRYVSVREYRTSTDRTEEIKYLSDVM